MTRTLVCLALCGTLLPRVASAQDMPPPWDPTLMITINAGLTSGGDLWELPPQPQFVIGNSALDTLHLGRVLRPGLVAGLGATYFFKPNFGLSGEVTYFGIAGEQRCRGPAVYQTDTLNANINQQACETANGTHVNTSVVGFLLGVTWRGSATARVQPLLRGMIGPGLIGNSYVKTTGTVFAPGICPIGCNVVLLDDENPAQFTTVINLVAGATIYLSPAYRLRFEVRDVIASLPTATGIHPNGTSQGTIGQSIKHVPTFTFGLDLALERRRERRY